MSLVLLLVLSFSCKTKDISKEVSLSHYDKLGSEIIYENDMQRQLCHKAIKNVDMATRCNVFVSVEFLDPNDMKPILIGETNLPDNTQLGIEIGKSGVFGTVVTSVVKNGKFRTKRITNLAKTQLSPGRYNISIVSVLMGLQPKSVTKILGKDGENLRGKLVEEVITGHYIARYETILELGGGKDSEYEDRRVQIIQKKSNEIRSREFNEIKNRLIQN